MATKKPSCQYVKYVKDEYAYVRRWAYLRLLAYLGETMGLLILNNITCGFHALYNCVTNLDAFILIAAAYKLFIISSDSAAKHNKVDA